MNTLPYSVYWDIGAHIRFKSCINKSIYDSIDAGMYTTQFYLGSARSAKRHNPTNEDINKSNKLLERFPMNVFIHTPHVLNFAGSKACAAWCGDDTQNAKTERTIVALEHELAVLEMLDTLTCGVVIHPGNHINRKIGLQSIAKSLNKVKIGRKAKVILENAAGQGTDLATTFEELEYMYSQIDNEKKAGFGFCIDTAHIYGYGEYNLSITSEVERMFEEFDDLIGLGKLSLIHLNDSKVPFGSRKDRHERIGEGFIWGESVDSLLKLLSICKENSIPIVMETCVDDMEVISNLKKQKKE
jgi:deoxyribonuclease-4